MEYVLKSSTSKQVPFLNKEGVYGITVVIRTGIVNQTYNGFENLDVGFCPLEKTDTVDDIEVKIGKYARAFVANKYPTT